MECKRVRLALHEFCFFLSVRIFVAAFCSSYMFLDNLFTFLNANLMCIIIN